MNSLDLLTSRAGITSRFFSFNNLALLIRFDGKYWKKIPASQYLCKRTLPFIRSINMWPGQAFIEIPIAFQEISNLSLRNNMSTNAIFSLINSYWNITFFSKKPIKFHSIFKWFKTATTTTAKHILIPKRRWNVDFRIFIA